MTFDVMPGAAEIESLPEYEAVKARFIETFAPYMRALQASAAEAALREELGARPLCANPDFVSRVCEALGEGVYAPGGAHLLSVNPAYLSGGLTAHPQGSPVTDPAIQ